MRRPEAKELSAYQVIPDYQDRVVARVLSTPEAVSECAMLGFSGKNLICMQGPFTEDLNVAMLRAAQAFMDGDKRIRKSQEVFWKSCVRQKKQEQSWSS